MRIFTLKLPGWNCVFAFCPRFYRKLEKDAEQYTLKADMQRLNLDISPGTQSPRLDLHAVLIGLKPAAEVGVKGHFVVEKLCIKGNNTFNLKANFSKSSGDIPVPLVYVYEKKPDETISIRLKDYFKRWFLFENKDERILTAQPTDLLQACYKKLVNCYEVLNKDLKGAENLEVVNALKDRYRDHIESLGRELFSAMNEKFPGKIKAHGVLLERYFLFEEQGKISSEDTLHLETNNRPEIKSRSKEIVSNDKSTKQAALSENNSIKETLDGSPISESSPECECNNRAQLSAPVEKDVKSEWSNPELKDQAVRLILDYKKHLSEKFFFRGNDEGEKKMTQVDGLLHCLITQSPETFKKRLDFFRENIHFFRHRDGFIISRLGILFKGVEKTKGELLIEKLYGIMANELAIRNESDAQICTLTP
jgi:hypothetical protein